MSTRLLLFVRALEAENMGPSVLMVYQGSIFPCVAECVEILNYFDQQVQSKRF